MKRQRNLLLATAIASVLLPQTYAHAQGALEEIIVTAERRATTETTTAISMNVLSGDDLANTQTKNIADLQASTPNVTINNPGGFNSINIRGIGNSAIQPSISVGVAVFQDGMLNAETITLSNQFLDLGTVEVLRGPQGTFVGGSSTGGAIRLNSVKPEIAGGVKGFIEAQTGTKSQVKITGAVNLPISDTFAARIAFNQEKRDSYFYNRGGLVGRDPANPFQMPGSVNDQGGRVSLLWAPSDKLEFVWRSEFNRSDIQGSPAQPNPRTFTLGPAAGSLQGTQANSRYWCYDGPAISCFGDTNSTLPGVQGGQVATGIYGSSGTTLATNAGSVDPNHDPDVLGINLLDAQFDSIVDRHSLEWTYEFDSGMTFRSLTGFVHNDVKYIEDQDATVANAVVNRNDVGPDNNYYSQEINLISAEGPLNWIVGSNWFYRSTIPNNVSETFTCGINPATGIFTPCPLTFSGNTAAQFPQVTFAGSYAVARAGAVFGQLNWTFVDDLEATIGARYNVDKNYSIGRDLPGGVVAINTNPNLAAVPAPTLNNCPADVVASSRYTQFNFAGASCSFPGAPSSYEDENVTYKVGLNYTPGDNLFYAFYARGYKAGGAQAAGTFEPEQVDDIEIGYKGQLLDGRATFSVGAFYMDYQQIQQQAFVATTANAGNNVVNIGEATIQGIEAEFNAKFGGLGISVNAGWVDSELGDISIIDRTIIPDASVRAPGTTADLPQCAAGVTPNLNVQSSGGCVDYRAITNPNGGTFNSYINASGNPNIYSPELQYGITLDYDIVGANGTWTPRVSFSHTDSQYINLVRYGEAFWEIPERDLVNVSLTYAADKWLTQAFVNNAADETYIAAIGTGGGLTNDSVVYGNPLVWGLRFRYNFE